MLQQAEQIVTLQNAWKTLVVPSGYSCLIQKRSFPLLVRSITPLLLSHLLHKVFFSSLFKLYSSSTGASPAIGPPENSSFRPLHPPFVLVMTSVSRPGLRSSSF